MNTNYFERYSLWRSILATVKGKDHVIFLNRSGACMNVDIQIWRSKVYTKPFIGVNSAEVLSWLEEPQTHYEDPVLISNFSAHSDVDHSNLDSEDISETVYMEWMKFESSTAGYHFSYEPTAWEVNNYLIINRNSERMTESSDTKSNLIRGFMMDMNKASKKNFVPRKEADRSEISMALTSLTARNEVSLEDMSSYLWNRHEMFCLDVQAKLGLNEQNSDVAFKDYISFRNLDLTIVDSNKTPDFIFELENTIWVVECAVTDGSKVSVINRKVEKYEAIVDYINGLIADKEVKLAICVLDSTRQFICTSEEIQDFGPIYANSEDGLLGVMSQVESIPNYQNVRSAFNLVTDESGVVDKKELLVKTMQLTDIVVGKDLPNRGFDIEGSMIFDGPDRASKFNSRTMVDVVKSYEKSNSDNAATDMDLAKFENTFVDTVHGNFLQGNYSHEIEKIEDSSREETSANIIGMLENEKERSKNLKVSAPKPFKIPLIHKDSKGVDLPENYNSIFSFYDGTEATSFKFKGFEEEDYDTNLRPGIGINDEEIDDFFQNFNELFRLDKDLKFDNLTDMLEATEMFSILEGIEELMLEVTRLSGRRHIFKETKGKTVFRKSDKFSILVANGPMLKDSNQMVIKVFCESDKAAFYNNLARGFELSETTAWFNQNKKIYETGWFSIQMADVEHYMTIKSRVMTIVSDMWCRAIESGTNTRIILKETSFPGLYRAPIAIMLEHKRNTSTSCQLTRYLIHSATGLFSDHSKLADEIFSTPIRTTIQAWVVRQQALWFSEMVLKTSLTADFVKMTSSEGGNNDRIFLKSMFYPSVEIEFQMMMMEMYYGNLFNYRHGFKAHRDKAILEKMMKVEDVYKDVCKDGGPEKPWEELYYGKDKMCTYSPEFLKSAFKFYLNKESSKEYIVNAALHSVQFGYNKILKMTRSVSKIRDDFGKFIPVAPNLEKCTVLEAIWDEISKLPETSLMEIAKQDEEVLAIFSTFSKDQIGGAREILIQSIKTRIHTAIINNFFEYLCKTHEKDMTTKEHKKKEAQGSTMLRHNSEMRKHNQEGRTTCLSMALNSDASKWAPSMVMSTFIKFLESIKKLIPDNLFNYFLTIYSAYANKLIYIPESLRRKLETWSESMVEEDSIMKEIAKYATSSGLSLFHSGMGQGNFQHGSSFIHCLIDDYSDHLMKEVFGRVGVELDIVTLISSDDSTKMVLMRTPTCDNTVQTLNRAVRMFVDMYSGIRKLGNVHINWKKTALQMIITEFNSVFSIQKRMCVASVKDAYNSVNIVDMTRPEEAVLEVLSNVRRLLDSGCYMETIQMALSEMRQKLIKWYNMSDFYLDYLKKRFKCEEEDFPHILGFVPLKMPVETLLFGPEVLYGAVNNPEIKKFLEFIYSNSEMTTPTESEDIEEDVTTHVKLEVGKRANKNLMELKKKILSSSSKSKLSEVRSEIIMVCPKMNSSLLTDFKLYLKEYICKVKSNYAFSSTFRYNSIVRAMQYMDSVGPAATRDVKDNIISWIDQILTRNVVKTHFSVFEGMTVLCGEHEEFKERMKHMEKKHPNRHPKYRSLMMYKKTMMSVATEADIISVLFSRNTESRTSHYVSAREFCEIMGVDIDEMIANPLAVLSNLFPRKPLMRMKAMLRWFIKLYEVKSVSLVSDFPSSNNRRLDLWSLYGYKSSPFFVFSDVELEMDRDQFKTSDMFMTFGSFEDLTKMKVDESRLRTRSDKVMKMLSDSELCEKLTENTATFNLGSYNFLDERPLYTEREKQDGQILKKWVGKDGMIMLNYKSSRKVEVVQQGNPSEACQSMVAREINLLTIRAPDLIFFFKTGRNYYEEVDKQRFDLKKMMDKLYKAKFKRLKLHLKRGFSSWVAMMIGHGTKIFLTKQEMRFHLDVNPFETGTHASKLVGAYSDMAKGKFEMTSIDRLLVYTPRFKENFLELKGDRRAEEEDTMEPVGSMFSTIMSASLSGKMLTLDQLDDLDLFEDDGPQRMGPEIEADEDGIEKLTITKEMLIDLSKKDVGSPEAVMEGGEKLISIITMAVSWASKIEMTMNLRPLTRLCQEIPKLLSMGVAVMKAFHKREDGEEFSDLTCIIAICSELKNNMMSARLSKNFKVFKILRARVADEMSVVVGKNINDEVINLLMNA